MTPCTSSVKSKSRHSSQYDDILTLIVRITEDTKYDCHNVRPPAWPCLCRIQGVAHMYSAPPLHTNQLLYGDSRHLVMADVCETLIWQRDGGRTPRSLHSRPRVWIEWTRNRQICHFCNRTPPAPALNMSINQCHTEALRLA